MIDIQYFIKNKLYEHRTSLCDIMDYYGSDKAGRINNRHNYTTFYDYIFKEIKDNIYNVFEIGLGTTNKSIPSSMGEIGVPCGSLRGWREYFYNAHIYGADIDKEILYQENKIKTFYCDQTNPESIKNLWSNFNFEFDIIFDDGLHSSISNSTFFYNSIEILKENGIFIIEDIYLIETYEYFLNDIKTKFKQVDLVKIPNSHNNDDNNLIIIIK